MYREVQRGGDGAKSKITVGACARQTPRDVLYGGLQGAADGELGLFRRKMTFYFLLASHVSHVEVFPPLVESVDITSGPFVGT